MSKGSIRALTTSVRVRHHRIRRHVTERRPRLTRQFTREERLLSGRLGREEPRICEVVIRLERSGGRG